MAKKKRKRTNTQARQKQPAAPKKSNKMAIIVPVMLFAVVTAILGVKSFSGSNVPAVNAAPSEPTASTVAPQANERDPIPQQEEPSAVETSETDVEFAAVDSDLVIQVAEVSTTAIFYPVEVDGTALEVLAVEAPDGTIRTAFNTCQVCFSSGRGYYIQSGDVLVCQNCGNRFRTSEVEITRGGCNPVPIFEEEKTIEDTSITIPYEVLLTYKDIFANWKV